MSADKYYITVYVNTKGIVDSLMVLEEMGVPVTKERVEAIVEECIEVRK